MNTFRSSEESNLQKGFCYFPGSTQLCDSVTCYPFLWVTSGAFHLFTGSEICANDNNLVDSCPSPFSLRLRVSWGEEEEKDFQWLLSCLLCRALMLGCKSYILRKLCVLQHRRILFLEGCAGMTKTPDIAQRKSKNCSCMLCNCLVKANSSMLFQAVVSQNLCALVREEN